MRSPKNAFVHGSISKSIQRQVATAERTMGAGMDELADNVSEVTDSISSSFDALTPFFPTPTEWGTGLMRSYCHKIHALPFDHHDELCTKIDKMAKNLKTTVDVVLYAMFLIDRRTKNNKVAKEEQVTNSLLNIDEVNNAMKELEMVPEDDSVKPPPTSIANRPPIIVESAPLTTSLSVLVEIVSEDDISEVTLLRHELRFQREEQQKVTQVVLD